MPNTSFAEKKESKTLSGNNVTVTEILEYIIALYGIKDVSEAIAKINLELKTE